MYTVRTQEHLHLLSNTNASHELQDSWLCVFGNSDGPRRLSPLVLLASSPAAWRSCLPAGPGRPESPGQPNVRPGHTYEAALKSREDVRQAGTCVEVEEKGEATPTECWKVVPLVTKPCKDRKALDKHENSGNLQQSYA